MFSVAFEM